MFDQLDDPDGTPAARIDDVKARAQRQQTRRRAALALAAALVVAVPIGAALLLGGGEDRQPVDVADAVTTTTDAPDSTHGAAVAIEETTTTTTVVEETTTTTINVVMTRPAPTTPPPPPTTTTTVVAPDLIAIMSEEFGSGVTGQSNAYHQGGVYWRVEVRGRDLQPGLAYNVLVQSRTTDGSLGQASGLCDFVGGADGTGSCEGTFQADLGDPGYVSLFGYDPMSRGYRVVAAGPFGPT